MDLWAMAIHLPLYGERFCDTSQRWSSLAPVVSFAMRYPLGRLIGMVEYIYFYLRLLKKARIRPVRKSPVASVPSTSTRHPASHDGSFHPPNYHAPPRAIPDGPVTRSAYVFPSIASEISWPPYPSSRQPTSPPPCPTLPRLGPSPKCSKTSSPIKNGC